MPTTNGQPVEPGCYAEGHRGWYIGDRVIDIAESFGFVLDAEGQEVRSRYYSGDSDPESADFEIIHDIVDEAEAWLNDHTPDECPTCGEPVEWHPTGWASHVGLPGDCPYRLMDTTRSWYWHFHDGEFFLSPICDDPEECSDDTCAHWD